MNGVQEASGQRGAGRVSEAQLEQVHANRQPVSRARSIGQMGREIDIEESSRNRTARGVFDAVNAVVDAAFCEYCTFDELRGDELIIMVDCPEFLYYARTKWHSRLLKHLERSPVGRRIRKITFRRVEREQGDRTGMRFVPPES